VADTTSNFCLITLYLSACGLSRVRSTTLALDNPQAERYYPDSRMIHQQFKNKKEKRYILWN